MAINQSEHPAINKGARQQLSADGSSGVKAARSTAAFRLSGTTVSTTPPSCSKASTCSRSHVGSDCSKTTSATR
ncbi:hypothetical protein BHS06_29815 [Myxococcus xanthus]|uniref:hypothetical protein n=1 Tax=Myxococcus xanthus TaxID=34 RepID=UPI00116531C2|nr:hypothetical protein [Myxococcus xanthus]QDE92840.1 hypothetical protein BHS06_29815 [Myxococcus xanthus]